MGLLIVAMLIQGVAVAVVAIAVLWLTAKSIRRDAVKRGVRVVVIGGAALVAVLLFPSTLAWLLAGTVTSGENVSLAECHYIGPRLPPQASAITYHSNYLNMDATFTINENDFQAWIEQQAWEPHEIDPPKTDDLFLFGLELPEVRNGFVVSETFHPRGTGVHIVYDRDHQRCFYHFSSH